MAGGVAGAESPSADERELLVQRIVTSPHFAKASQLREILVFVTRRLLHEQVANIREQEIACKVLGRREDFNPAEDNIVRVQVSHLRKKLEQYYAAEGGNEQLTVTIPKGTYIPCFEPRLSAAAGVSQTASTPAEASAQPKLSDTSPPSRWRRLWPWIAAALLLQVAIAAAVYRLGRIQAPADSVSAQPAGAQQNPILQRIFATDTPVSIVVTDANLALLQNVLLKDISLNDYVGGKYPDNLLPDNTDPKQRRTLDWVASGRYTTIGDLTIATRCSDVARQFGAETVVRYARYINVRDFLHGNFILIGSRRGNPWVSLFEPKMNFVFTEDPTTHAFYFLNKHPQSGEQEAYLSSQDGHGANISYVDVALMPNLAKTGNVLIFDGAVMESNEAAAQLILGDELPEAVSKIVGRPKSNLPQSIEILLRVRAIEGTASGFDIVAIRSISI